MSAFFSTFSTFQLALHRTCTVYMYSVRLFE